MNESARCPACGLALPENRLSGLCPACAWRSLSEPEPESSPEPSPAPKGNTLMRMAGYEIVGELARGGMGIVYHARQLDPRRSVALKMLLPRQLGSAATAERFRLEVRALTELEHPAILPVFDVGEHEGLPFFTMKLATGGTLAERQGRYAGNWRAIAELMAGLAEAVQFAHQHGVLHRDLKPGNILFDDQDRAFVSDFGLAKLADAESDLTRSVDFLGTPRYVAPEIAAGSARQATTASDVYSLGAMLYELLAGHPPFEAEGVPALLKKIVEEEPLRPSRAALRSAHGAGLPAGAEPTAGALDGRGGIVPRDLEVICLKCLAKEPAGRYGSAGELARDLQAWLEGRPITARPVFAGERAWKWVRRNPLLAALATGLAIACLGGGLVWWRSDREVRQALKATKEAQIEAQGNLRASLLAQAKALGAAHETGQRWQALDALARATKIEPSLELRNEAAAALARADLREVLRFPAFIGGAGSPVVFSSDLQSYVAAEAGGGFAWRSTQDQTVLASFAGTLHAPARWFVLSPDDQHLAALLQDYTLQVWTLKDQQLLLDWKGNAQRPPAADFSPDGRSLAGFIPGQGLYLQQLDGTERRLLQRMDGRAIFLRFDPSGRRLAVVEEPGAITLWRCEAVPTRLWSLPMNRAVPWVAWSPDGQKLIAAADDGRGLRVLSAENGQLELVYSRHQLYPRQFEFDPTGRMVASLGQDWVLRLWDSRSGQELVTGIGRHRVCRFSRDGRRLTTAPNDNELAVLEIAPQMAFREFTGSIPGGEITANKLTCSADGRFLMITQPELHLFDTEAGTELATLKPSGGGMLCRAFFDRENSAVYYSYMNRGVFQRPLLAATNRPAADSSPGWGLEQLVAPHPDGVVWDTIQAGETWVCQTSRGVELWPHHEPQHARKVRAQGPLESVRVNEDGRWAAVADPEANRITIWDCVQDKVLTNLPAKGPSRVWFSPDSRWLVASVERGYCTWSTESWMPGASWEARLDSGDPGEVSFSRDSRLLAARHERETFRLLTFPECRELVTLKPPLVLPVRSACLRGDGQRLWLLTSGFRVFEWNLAELRTELGNLGLDWGP